MKNKIILIIAVEGSPSYTETNFFDGIKNHIENTNIKWDIKAFRLNKLSW